MLKWEEKVNLGNGRYITKAARITDTQCLMLYQNKIHEPKYQMYVEYHEEDAQPKRFYLTSTSIEEAEKEAVEVVCKFLQGETHAWLKRLNRLRKVAFEKVAFEEDK